MKTVLCIPQWQGGADRVTLEGARELRRLYPLCGEAPAVSVEEDSTLEKRNGIIGFDVLRRQMTAAKAMLQKSGADSVFAFGGGCDADVPVISWLNERYGGELTILWLDAHGDLNAPWESETALFYGMPLRSLTVPDCFGLLENSLPLLSSQIVHIGGRDFDEPEIRFMRETQLLRLSAEQLREGGGRLALSALPEDRPVYVHLDLDVLDPHVFPHTPLPVPDGLGERELFDLLEAVKGRLVGLGLYEYKPTGKELPLIGRLLDFGLAVGE